MTPGNAYMEGDERSTGSLLLALQVQSAAVISTVSYEPAHKFNKVHLKRMVRFFPSTDCKAAPCSRSWKPSSQFQYRNVVMPNSSHPRWCQHCTLAPMAFVIPWCLPPIYLGRTIYLFVLPDGISQILLVSSQKINSPFFWSS